MIGPPGFRRNLTTRAPSAAVRVPPSAPKSGLFGPLTSESSTVVAHGRVHYQKSCNMDSPGVASESSLLDSVSACGV